MAGDLAWYGHCGDECGALEKTKGRALPPLDTYREEPGSAQRVPEIPSTLHSQPGCPSVHKGQTLLAHGGREICV